MFVDIMFENHAWHRYWDGFHVSHNEPAITWWNVRIFFSDFFFLYTWIFSQWIFWQKSHGTTSEFFLGYIFYCHYFVYSNSTIIIKLTKPKTSYSLISKLSEVFEVTFFRISSKTLRRNGLYLFGLNTKQSLCSLWWILSKWF